jgi:hypothetical protein
MDFRDLVIMSLVFITVMAVIYKWKDLRKLYARIHVPQDEEPEAYQIP